MDQRIAPGVGPQEVGIGQDAVTQGHVTTTDGEQPRGQRSSRVAPKGVADG